MAAMLDDIEFLDDATRPEGPKLEGLTPQQKLPGQHLRMIHDHLRENMKVLREMIEKVAAGEMNASEVEDRAQEMAIISNYRRFGSLCGQQCQIVHMHHSIEDQAIFPVLSEKSAAFKRVVDRLVAEHEIVHEVLMRLVDALGRMAQDPNAETFANVRDLYAALDRILLSHLGYEEDGIGDALGYYEIGV